MYLSLTFLTVQKVTAMEPGMPVCLSPRGPAGHLEYTIMQVSFLTFLFSAFEFELSYFFDVILLAFLNTFWSVF